MKIKKQVYTKLPTVVKSLLLTSDGWLVGSSISGILEGEEPKDYDVIVPDTEKYQRTVLQLTSYANVDIEINSYGGLKCIGEDFTVDLWPQTLDSFLLAANKFQYSYNHTRQLLIKNQD